jgi:ParB/RepB/Spo0J family partition protein
MIIPAFSAHSGSSELSTTTALLSIDRLKSSRYQTRDLAFDNLEELENLANSIRTVGLLERPRVRKDPDDPESFEIISGHRRISAVSKFLGWKEIECQLYDELDEFDSFRLNLTENVQRHDLSPYEEGTAYLLCQKLFGLSDDEIAKMLQKSRQVVANRRELAVAANGYLKYADSSFANAFLRNFSSGHKEILKELSDPRMIRQGVKMIARGGSVRQIRRFVELFGFKDHEQRTRNHRQGTVCTRQELRSIQEVLSLFEHLREELPKEYIDRVGSLEDRILDSLLVCRADSANSNPFDDHRFSCPSCREIFGIERRIVPEQDEVLFIISPKNPNLNKVAVYPFPVYKVNS